jgi:hypothetical protein
MAFGFGIRGNAAIVADRFGTSVVGSQSKVCGAEVLKLGEEIAGGAVQVVFRIMGVDTEEIGGSGHQLPEADGSDRRARIRIESGFHRDVGPEERQPLRPGKSRRFQGRVAEIIVAHVQNEILDLGRATRTTALFGRAVRRKNDETFVICKGLSFSCERVVVRIAAFRQFFPEIEDAGPNPEVLCPRPKVDHLSHGSMCADEPKRQPTAEG